MKKLGTLLLVASTFTLLWQAPAFAYNGCLVGPGIVIDRPATCGYTAHGSGMYEAAGASWCVVVKRPHPNGGPKEIVESFCSDRDVPEGKIHSSPGDEVYATFYPAVCYPTPLGTCFDAGFVGAQDD